MVLCNVRIKFCVNGIPFTVASSVIIRRPTLLAVISDFDIENGDTLEDDAFPEEQFDAVVANPPFSAAWSAAEKFRGYTRVTMGGTEGRYTAM